MEAVSQGRFHGSKLNEVQSLERLFFGFNCNEENNPFRAILIMKQKMVLRGLEGVHLGSIRM